MAAHTHRDTQTQKPHTDDLFCVSCPSCVYVQLPGDAAGGQMWRQSSPHPLPHPHAYHTHTHTHLDEMVTSDADQLHHARRREKATAGGGEMPLGPEGDVESGVRSGHGHLSEGEDDHGHHGHPSLMQAAKRSVSPNQTDQLDSGRILHCMGVSRD